MSCRAGTIVYVAPSNMLITSPSPYLPEQWCSSSSLWFLLLSNDKYTFTHIHAMTHYWSLLSSCLREDKPFLPNDFIGSFIYAGDGVVLSQGGGSGITSVGVCLWVCGRVWIWEGHSGGIARVRSQHIRVSTGAAGVPVWGWGVDYLKVTKYVLPMWTSFIPTAGPRPPKGCNH